MFHRSLYTYILTALGLSLLALVLLIEILADSFLWEYQNREAENDLERAASQAAAQLLPWNPENAQLVREIGRATDFRFTIIDRSGVVLADSMINTKKSTNQLFRPEVTQALQGLRGVDRRKSAALGEQTVFLAIPTDPVIRLSRPVSDVETLTEGMKYRLLLTALPALFLAMVISYLVARPMTRRLEAMERFTATLAEGDYETALVSGGSGELGGVERSLEELRLRFRGLVWRLSEDRQKLASIIDGIPDAVLLFGADGRLMAANKAAEGLLRLPAHGREALSKEEVVRDPEILTALDMVHSSAKGPKAPARISWRDPEMELEVICRPMEDEGQMGGALLVMRDITKQIHLERIRSDFIANMAHELLTPLTAIRGAAETLIDSGDIGEGQPRKFLETIHRHAIRLGNIVVDVSQLSRIEGGGAPVVARRMDARRVVDDVVALFTAEAERSGIALGVEAPEEEVHLVSDAEKIESILLNLAQNAVRYTPSGGSVALCVRPTTTGVVYEVRDTGHGIPFKDIPRVTERFYRVDPGRSREKGGTGLGLSIVRHLVTGLKGKMTIESKLDKGTTVRVELPSLKAEKEEGEG